MRLSRTFLAATVTTVLVLAGCSSQEPEGDDESTRSAAEGTFPATVETAFGEITIEEQPERVVALGWGDAEVALALGVQPVGASDWLGFGGDGVGPWAEGLYEESPEIIDTLEPSYEAIAALEPDLILDVRSSGDQDRYDRLSEIATTVGIPEGGENWLTSMEDQTEMIAAALGLPEEGEQLLADVDEAYEEVVQAHPEWQGKTVSAAAKTSEGWGAYIEGDGRLETLSRFGFVQNPKIAALPTSESGFTVSISSEELDLLEADLIVAFPIYLETTAITEDPQWNQLNAVQEGRAIVLDGDLSNAFSASTPLAALYAVDGLAPLIEEALAGE
ncbi:iron-siderophore ABC transporter substrate-binding protein [uncultured Aeromicrobium sp.]|uniref:iron-siderophore ABC transporter substrate-binding protein n=1 Tax=uncultured Aeromicrobium sp. TaxID=337820 RepID=UPI0025CFC8E4|nr:iron-siderophore ABC transporter substrate-binding protein [uncultured Aeromicrobium sp.]